MLERNDTECFFFSCTLDDDIPIELTHASAVNENEVNVHDDVVNEDHLGPDMS